MNRWVTNIFCLMVLIVSVASCGGGGGAASSGATPVDVATLDGATDIATDSIFSYTFSKQMNTSTVNSNTYFIHPLPGVAQVVKTADISSCDPTLALAASITCASRTQCTLAPSSALCMQCPTCRNALSVTCFFVPLRTTS